MVYAKFFVCSFNYLSSESSPGPNLDVRDDQGCTPLHLAASRNHKNIVQILLDAGANSELLNQNDKTALDVCNSQEVFHLLRIRAEIHNRRERLAGVKLKSVLIDSHNQEPFREEMAGRADTLQDEVKCLRQAVKRVHRHFVKMDEDLLRYKRTGELKHSTLEFQGEDIGNGRQKWGFVKTTFNGGPSILDIVEKAKEKDDQQRQTLARASAAVLQEHPRTISFEESSVESSSMSYSATGGTATGPPFE